jgi:iduronate 2-sulfatase
VDLFPTLCELGGLPVPEPLHGVSLKPVLANPEIPWKKGAFSQYFKNKKNIGKVLGTSIRTDRYRYTEWRKKNQSGALEDVTLIDFQGNPNKNIAANPAHRDLIKRLAEFAKKSGTGLKP